MFQKTFLKCSKNVPKMFQNYSKHVLGTLQTCLCSVPVLFQKDVYLSSNSTLLKKNDFLSYQQKIKIKSID